MHSNTDHGDSGNTRSDRKQDVFEERWTHLLLNWINLCIQPKVLVQEINQNALLDIISKYHEDICDGDSDRKLLCSEDIEAFIKFNYPDLGLSNLAKHDTQRKQCIMASILLYRCCVSSRSVAVDDICGHLDLFEQELLLMFCEKLGATDVTVANVEAAVTGALTSISAVSCTEHNSKLSLEVKAKDEEDTSDSPIHESNSTIASQLPKIAGIAPKTVTVLQSSIVPDSSRDVSHYSESLSSFGSLDSLKVYNVQKEKRGVKFQEFQVYTSSSSEGSKCQPVCSCTACDKAKKGCGDTGDTSKCGKQVKRCLRKEREIPFNTSKWFKIIGIMVAIGILFAVVLIPFIQKPAPPKKHKAPPPPTPLKHNTTAKRKISTTGGEPTSSREPTAEEDFQEWECRDHLCQKVYQGHEHMHFFKSLSRCTLLCIGPLLWPWPIGYTSFSNTITAFAKSRTDYKFKEVMSVVVHQYLAEAFKLFLADLERLERIDLHSSNKNRTQDLEPLQLVIEMHVNKDADPRIRLDTDEAYTLKIATTESQLKVEIQSASFAGIRHGLETLSQLIYLDQATGHLITLSQVVIKDAPTYKYRGLMIDTGRNYIPVPDLMRTIDAMSSVKFNTFHWRISDSTSFPWLLPDYPELFEYGAYDRSLIYTTEDVRTIVSRAGIRGIRVLLEVSAPGPVGRAWSWTTASACQQTRKNTTQCDKELCRRLKMKRSAFDILENIYFTILQLTKVDDIFHMSDSVFSFIECYYIVDSREGFLSQALDRLRVANKGLLPALPIIWYTEHLTKTLEAEPWHGLGVQLNEWQNNPVGDFLTHYKVIHSSKWDLSCEMKYHRCMKYKTWQELYKWRQWRTLEVFNIEGGEVTLWTDMVDGTNLDTHLWPRAAAVAERLWSDSVANYSTGGREILRLDAQRWRLLLRSVKVQPVWPIWCTFNPRDCLERIQ
ncbi:probable beta-hexosaminidase fdl [Choristoneura fumiferana]|uniref:probable beta-hexosaminidase fdl n=1 Tax=Choristoneura fumiferana TaxID=7141 RepID=UPI003D153C35